MRYTLAKRANINDIYALVQNTIKSTYPKYYPTEVVDFFCEHHSLAAITQDVENGNVSVLLVNGNMVGTGSFVDNHITRVYVLPEYQGMGYGTLDIKQYRRQGIAMWTLALLVKAAKEKGIPQISLEATEAGRPLYERFGFVDMENEMELV